MALSISYCWTKNFPLVVLEAKPKTRIRWSAKEQARKYAKSLDCRFVILSNGNLHYFWDLQQGNPHIIAVFLLQTHSRAIRSSNLTRGA